LIKVSNNVHSSLVSNDTFSKILPSSVWAQVRYEQPKMAKNLPYYDVTHKKTKPNLTKKFFSLRTRILAEFFKGLNSSLVQSAEELCNW